MANKAVKTLRKDTVIMVPFILPKGAKVINISEVSKIAMVDRNENWLKTIIHNGVVKDWVGIGWIDSRPATKQDYAKITIVVEKE